MISKNLGEVMSGPKVSQGHLILNYTSGTGCGGKFYTSVELICKKNAVVCIIISAISKLPLYMSFVVFHMSVASCCKVYVLVHHKQASLSLHIVHVYNVLTFVNYS